MVRLAVEGLDVALRDELSFRLHDAELVELVDAADAVAVLRDRPIDEIDPLQFCRTDQPVLMLMTSCSPGVSWRDVARRMQNHQRVSYWNPARFQPSSQLIQRQLKADAVGEPGLIRLHRWQSSLRGEAHRLLFSSLISDLDLTMWLMGRSPDRIFALQHRNVEHVPSGAPLQVHLGFPGGGMAVLNVTDQLPPGDGYRSLSVIGSSGAAYSDDHSTTQLSWQGGAARAFLSTEGLVALTAMLQAFVCAVRDGADLSATVGDWKLAAMVNDRIEASLCSGKPVGWEDR